MGTREMLAVSAKQRQNRDMRFRAFLALATTSVAGLAAVVACTTDYQKGEGDPAYGAPNALENQKPPRPTLESAGAEGGASGSSGSANTPKCVQGGGTLVDGGPCAVSFKNDVLKIFGTAAAPSQACGVTDCHGGTTPPAQPPIEPGTPAETYAAFQAFTAAGKPYINPCSIDPAASTILCNVQATACGSKMPKGGGQIAAADLTKIETWVKCGAPNN